MSEIKKSTTIEEQINLLRDRGCEIRDEDFAMQVLKDVSYYRLTAYLLPYKEPNNTYRKGTDFEKIYQIYEFDRKLRNILFSAIEIIEISLRSRLSYYHANKYGPLGYMDEANYNERHKHDVFETKYKAEIQSNEKVPFVNHHIVNYNGEFPIWVLMELFTFGMLSYFYNDLPTQDRKAVSSDYGINFKDMASWLRCCTDLRNICAHYGRLYYRVFSAIPSGLELDKREERRLWGALQAIKGLYPSKDEWNNKVLPELQELINDNINSISLQHMAFPDDWYLRLRK